MSPDNPVVGPEGIRVDLSGLSGQVSSIEKLGAADREGIRREIEGERERINAIIAGIRRELELATASLAMQVTEKEDGIRRETLMATSTIKDELAAAIEAARAAAAADTQASRHEREMEIKRLDALVDAEFGRVMTVMDERMARVLEVQNVRADAHKAVHDQLDESTRVALITLNSRLDGFPREYASVTALGEVKESLGKLAEDIRLRAETAAAAQNQINLALERRLVEGLQGMIDTARREVRPVQDANAGRQAIVAAVGIGITVILFGIAIIGFILARLA